VRQNREDFYALSLEVKNQNSIFDGLKKYVSGELISDYQCEACNQRVELEKRVTLDKLPNTLIVHLQRIIFDFDTLRNVKLNDRVEFPNVLNLREFTTGHLRPKDEAAAKMAKKMSSQGGLGPIKSRKEDGKEDDGAELGGSGKQHEDMDGQVLEQELEQEVAELSEDSEANVESKQDEQDFEFKLVGVVCHMGSAEAGHYRSYINTERDRENNENVSQKSREEWLATDKQKWLEFNDSSVQSFNFNQLEQACFGGQQNQNAYMLIYERRVKDKMKVVIPEDVAEALACDGTAMSSADAPLFGVFPHLRQELTEHGQELVQHDAEKKEHFTLVDFNSARKFVPNQIYKQVHKDNLLFLSEKQVFSDNFYRCTLELLQLAISGPTGEIANTQHRFELVYKLLDRTIFDLLVNSSSNSTLKDMTDLLVVMLSKSDQAVEFLVQQRVFAPKESLGKDERNFFETLATHQD